MVILLDHRIVIILMTGAFNPLALWVAFDVNSMFVTSKRVLERMIVVGVIVRHFWYLVETHSGLAQVGNELE